MGIQHGKNELFGAVEGSESCKEPLPAYNGNNRNFRRTRNKSALSPLNPRKKYRMYFVLSAGGGAEHRDHHGPR